MDSAYDPHQSASERVSAPLPNSSISEKVHDASINCRCGCVPNVMSLFQMAELRAKRRKEKEETAEKRNIAKELSPSS